MARRGSSSVGRAAAFQAACRGFDPRLPLHDPFGSTQQARAFGSGQNVPVSRPAAASRDVPLATLLSQAFAAWTIEVDNVVEAVMPHVVSKRGSLRGEPGSPRLVSVAMYWTALRWLEDGITFGELGARTGLETNLNGLRRWGYVAVDGAPADREAVRIQPDLVLRATASGTRARIAWATALDEVQRRWQDRFGEASARLGAALGTIDAGLGPAQPDSLPILGPALSNVGRAEDVSRSVGRATEPAFAIRLGRVMTAFALETDAASAVPMAVGANLLGVAGDEPVAVPELPALSGVSGPAIAMALTVARKRGLVEPAATDGRTKRIRLTEVGAKAKAGFAAALRSVEERWAEQHGRPAVDALRLALSALVEPLDSPAASIRAGLAPPADGWRASEPADRVLPHAPMVLHRGGWPDGA
jgi:hypothetical protein